LTPGGVDNDGTIPYMIQYQQRSEQMSIHTINGNKVEPGSTIVIFENFPGMNMSQWCVAVYHSVAAYDSPYDPIIWLPKSGVFPDPAFAEQHATKHAQNRELAELIAKSIRAEIDDWFETSAEYRKPDDGSEDGGDWINGDM
jgi:hypothetical protein